MSHRVHDDVGMALAKRIARELEMRPEWLALARENLRRWRELNQGAPALLACYQEWQELLERPVADVVAALTAMTEEGQRLRQNSPFAGALTPAEVWEIKRQVHETSAA